MLLRFGIKQIPAASSGPLFAHLKTNQVAKQGVSTKTLTLLRQFHSSANRHAQKPHLKCMVYSEVSPKLKARQALFQVDNDVPVFLKGGIKDQILYRLTVALNIMGIIMSYIFFAGRDNPGEKK